MLPYNLCEILAPEDDTDSSVTPQTDEPDSGNIT